MNLEVTLAGKTFKNPVTTASGTFGSGAEYEQFVDLAALGAVTTKGVANVPWEGNPTPRVAETYGGMLNAVGLQNPGIDLFCKRDIPHLKEKGASIIVNVCGRSTSDYVEVVERLADEPVDLLEINVSCPNVKEGGIIRERTLIYHQRMIACYLISFRKVGKHSALGGMNRCYFSVHWNSSSFYDCAKGMSDNLMPKAYTQDWKFSCKMPDDI